MPQNKLGSASAGDSISCRAFVVIADVLEAGSAEEHPALLVESLEKNP